MQFARLLKLEKHESNLIQSFNGSSLFCSESAFDSSLVAETSVYNIFFPLASVSVYPFSSDIQFLSSSSLRKGLEVSASINYFEDSLFQPDSSKFYYSLVSASSFSSGFYSLTGEYGGGYFTDGSKFSVYPENALSFDSYDEALNYAIEDYSSRFFPHSLNLSSNESFGYRDYIIFIYSFSKYEEVFYGGKNTVTYYSNFFKVVAPATPACCYPDFSPIVRILGGSPSFVQLENLKSICHLLGVDTAENGLKDCDLMKEYLKRLNQILGGSPYPEPNDNLKSICYLLGVDSAENGLKDCELSKDYVKRISKMLGAE